jgi:hypothetical protein
MSETTAEASPAPDEVEGWRGRFENCVMEGATPHFSLADGDAWYLDVAPGGFVQAGLIMLLDGVTIRALEGGGFRIEGPRYVDAER